MPESDATEPEPQPEPEPVPLTALTGLLEPCGNGFCLDQTRLYFGPWWFLNHTVASHDYDADGAVSSPLGELEGLLGAEVQVEAVDDDEGQSVINLNGLPWRSLDEQPPWAGGPDGEVLAPLGDDADGDHSGSSDGPPEDLPAPAQP